MGDSINMRWRKRITILVVSIMSACSTTPPKVSEEEAVSAILSWLDCDECYNGQYEYVISLGPQIKKELQKAIENQGAFADVLDDRKKLITQKASRIAIRQLGLGENFGERCLKSSEDICKRFITRKKEIEDSYMHREKARYMRRATKALRNLSWRNPAKKSDPDGGRG